VADGWAVDESRVPCTAMKPRTQAKGSSLPPAQCQPLNAGLRVRDTRAPRFWVWAGRCWRNEDEVTSFTLIHVRPGAHLTPATRITATNPAMDQTRTRLSVSGLNLYQKKKGNKEPRPAHVLRRLHDLALVEFGRRRRKEGWEEGPALDGKWGRGGDGPSFPRRTGHQTWGNNRG
jgi:hypothetical protein